ncbi:MAG TPA: hypothetical protein VG126_07310 [Thermoleophilaceae bacterium]|nr:hypothetical protein [Thermoleophilaceae bacterium]
MKPRLRRLPSPALVIACVALFVSLGGVSYGLATGSIDSRELKNNTIRSKDVRNNTLRTFDIRNNEVRGFDIRNSTIQGRDVAFDTLTGTDVSEASLAKVPSAATADTAISAGTADSVGGVGLRRFNYAAEQGSGPVTVLDAGGLRLDASCGAGGALEVRATPADPNAELSASGDLQMAPLGTALVNDAGAGVIALANPNGSVVTVQVLAVEQPNGVNGTSNDCGFFGIAEAG